MVATAHDGATRSGVAMLERGGNAMDAAVAAAFALGVCEPAASGLGGQTMILYHDAESRKTIALDGSSRAPNRAVPGSVGRKARLHGHRATTVPSTPATLDYALRRYGTLKLRRVLKPAIELAENGYPVSELQHALARRERKNLRTGAAAWLFLKDGKRTYRVGERFRQPVLAETLKRIARLGVKTFYNGRIARMIHADMVQNGGLVRRDDLAQVPWPIERRPLSCRFGPLRVMTFPPPGAGRTLIEMLNILSEFPPRRRDPDTPRGAVLLAEIIRTAFMDRRDRPYDPEFYAQVEERRMISQEYARSQARKIRRRLKGHGETTHLSVMDRHGNVAALTQSIERVYGSGVANPELGFLYNNYMSAFEYEDISHPYYLRPNAAPWASVAPTIVFRGRTPWLAVGSPGSERITPSILQVLLRLESHGPYEAVDAPRLYCSLDRTVSLEASRMRDDIPRALERHGFTLKERDPYSFYLGCVQLVMKEKRRFLGVADPRRDGSAGGPLP
jgi:gamma-glutamyltranspeptidase/glutathione hydrolase